MFIAQIEHGDTFVVLKMLKNNMCCAFGMACLIVSGKVAFCFVSNVPF